MAEDIIVVESENKTSILRTDREAPLSSAVPLSLTALTGVAGTSLFASPGDHRHAHGVQTDPTLHALATVLAHGFMSSTDKTALSKIIATDNVTVWIDTTSGNDSNDGLTAGTAVLTIPGAQAKFPQFYTGQCRLRFVNGAGSTSWAPSVAWKLPCGIGSAEPFLIMGGFTQVGSGTVASVALGVITAQGSPGWTVDAWFGMRIRFTSGALNGRSYDIRSNTASTISVHTFSAPGAANNDTFVIEDQAANITHTTTVTLTGIFMGAVSFYGMKFTGSGSSISFIISAVDVTFESCRFLGSSGTPVLSIRNSGRANTARIGALHPDLALNTLNFSAVGVSSYSLFRPELSGVCNGFWGFRGSTTVQILTQARMPVSAFEMSGGSGITLQQGGFFSCAGSSTSPLRLANCTTGLTVSEGCRAAATGFVDLNGCTVNGVVVNQHASAQVTGLQGTLTGGFPLVANNHSEVLTDTTSPARGPGGNEVQIDAVATTFAALAAPVLSARGTLVRTN